MTSLIENQAPPLAEPKNMRTEVVLGSWVLFERTLTLPQTVMARHGHTTVFTEITHHFKGKITDTPASVQERNKLTAKVDAKKPLESEGYKIGNVILCDETGGIQPSYAPVPYANLQFSKGTEPVFKVEVKPEGTSLQVPPETSEPA